MIEMDNSDRTDRTTKVLEKKKRRKWDAKDWPHGSFFRAQASRKQLHWIKSIERFLSFKNTQQNLKDFFSHMSIKDQNLIDSPCSEGVFCAGDFYVASPFVGDRNGFNRGIRCLMMFDDARHDVRHGVWWFVVACKAVYQGTPRADGVQLEEVHKMHGFAKGRNRTE